MNEIYVKGLEDASLVALNLIDELDCKSVECQRLRDKIRQYYTWILKRRIDKIGAMLEQFFLKCYLKCESSICKNECKSC